MTQPEERAARLRPIRKAWQRMSRTTTVGLALLIVGVITGAVGANALQANDRFSILGSGLFTVDPGEMTNFNVSLVDGRGGAPARILLRLFDANGTVVARRDVTLAPGQSATLRYGQPGVLRAQAQIAEPTTTLLGDQRTVLSTVEISGIGDPKSLDLNITARRRFVCSSDDGAGSGRLPD
jgi:hypothetical protein